MAGNAPSAPRRYNRLGLYLPYAALAVLAVGWSIAWLAIRQRTVQGLDEWLAAEAASGRTWTCADRAVSGYPFRIEISCAGLRLERPDLRADFGRLAVVTQIYQPRRILAELAGPLRLEAGAGAFEASWRLFQASFTGAPGSFERISFAADGLRVEARIPPGGQMPIGSEFAGAGERVELHVRPTPGAAASFQAALTAREAIIPGLNELIGGTEPALVEIEARASEIRDVAARPLPEEIERWRAAGGRIALERFRLVKGARRVEGRGELGIDAAHRAEGQIELSAARLEGLLGLFASTRGAAAGALIGILTGRPPPPEPAPPAGATDALRPLPPLRLANGRVQLGPVAIPGLRLPALY